MSFRVLGQVVVVLSSASAIKDLLEMRGETYSDRPSFPLHEMYVLTPSPILSIYLTMLKCQIGCELALAYSSQGRRVERQPQVIRS